MITGSRDWQVNVTLVHGGRFSCLRQCIGSCSVVSDSVTLLDCSLPGSSVQGILQAGILEWVAISSSRGSSRPRDLTYIPCVSCIGRWVLYHWATWEALEQWLWFSDLDICWTFSYKWTAWMYGVKESKGQFCYQLEQLSFQVKSRILETLYSPSWVWQLLNTWGFSDEISDDVTAWDF